MRRGMSPSDESKKLVRRVLKVAGTTYADKAGIRVNDKPMPLFQLLVLCMLASKPIDAKTAMRAARELFNAGLCTPADVLAADRRAIISAFGRAHYVRYDEELSATRLTAMAQRVRDECLGRLARDRRTWPARRRPGETNAEEFQGHWRYRRRHFPAGDPGQLDLGAAVLRRPGHGHREESSACRRTPSALGKLSSRKNARLAAALVRIFPERRHPSAVDRLTAGA